MLNKNNLNMAKLASKADSKYTLAGILVEPTRTVVTDGYSLMVMALPAILPDDFPKNGDVVATGTFEPFLLPSDTAAKILKVLPKKESIPILNHAAIGSVSKSENGGTQAVMMTTNLETSNRFDIHCIEGKFPNWQAVVSDPAAASMTLTANAEILIPLLQQFVYAGSPAVTVRIYGPEAAIRFDGVSKEGQHITAMLMPMRGDDKTPAQYPELAAIEV